jgi:hypothetical protein
MKRNYTQVTETAEQMTNEEIIAIIETMVSQPGSAKEKQRLFQKSFPEFTEKYPTLFQMACEPDFNMERLVYMLSMREAVSAQKISQHQASVNVGENLFQEYVKPLVEQKKKDDK